MTERLYYTEPALSEFDATVAGAERHEGLPALILDRTAFYPTSGGQPHDTGSLNGVRVSEVVERDDGAILHVVGGRSPSARLSTASSIGNAVSTTCSSTRDSTSCRRRSTGSGTRERSVSTLVRPSRRSTSIASCRPQAIVSAEDEANRIVWQDCPVSIRFVTVEQAASLDLRKDPGRSGVLRVIGVEGFDLSACGGTHVARSGEVGIIVVSAWEKLRGGLRLEFLCGGRAQRAYRVLRDSVAGCIRHLSVVPEELPAAIERAQAENKDLQEDRSGRSRSAWRASKHWRSRRARSRSQVSAVWSRPLTGGTHTASRRWPCPSCPDPGFRVALFSMTDPVLAVVARSPDSTLDARATLAALLERFGGKGGGKPDLAQGGGLAGDLQEMLQVARASLLP